MHCLTWLTVGNAVGLLLATLLLFPRAGDALGPLTYGRWVPLHLNLQLYGWCGLAMVGLLFKWYLPRRASGRLPLLAVDAWSSTLAFACVFWLAGHSSGKVFLEWSGASRLLLAANLALLWLVLLVCFCRRLTETREPRWSVVSRGLMLALLLTIPAVLYWATGPAVYPPINPDSGGPTGISLLGSSLGAIGIIMLCPVAVGLRRSGTTRRVPAVAIALIVHFALFLVLDHGNHSHHEAVQIAALASLLLWPLLLVVYLRGFEWPESARRWLIAFCGWGAALVGSAFLTFLPGVLERWKFTNALVGHAHLALGGMATSFNVIALVTLNEKTALARLFSARRPFALWHAGLALYVGVMLLLGTIEGNDRGLLFRAHGVVDALYGARWIAGALMLAASIGWLSSAFRAVAVSEAEPARRTAIEAA